MRMGEPEPPAQPSPPDDRMDKALFEFYLERGLVVLPLRPGTKEPKVKGWTELPRDELLNAFAPGDNIGIRLEPPVFVVDVDDARLYRLIADYFPTTLTTRTARGYHFYYSVDDITHYPENDKRSRLVQLLARGSQTVAPPSRVNGHEYHFVDPEAPIATLTESDLRKLRALLDALASYESLIRKFAEVWDEGHRHNLSLWLNGALRKLGVDKFEAAVVVKAICLLAEDPELEDRLRALKDTFEKPVDEVAGLSRLHEELASIVGPEKAEALIEKLRGARGRDEDEAPFGEDGHGNAQVVEVATWPEIVTKEPRKPKRLVGGEVFGDYLVEVAEGARLLVYHLPSGSLEVRDEFEHNGETYRALERELFPLPGVPERIGPDPTLWRETKEFIMQYFDHLDPRVYDVMVAAVAWSYFYREVNGPTPFLMFLGPWRSGKTHALEVLEALCYRARRVGEPSEASFFRVVENLRPTLLVDEAHVVNGDPNFRALLAMGYKPGGVVPRVVDPEKPGLDGIAFFTTFSFVICASREPLPDDIMSRMVVINCERNLRPTAKRIDEIRARGLRTRWLAQRLRLFGKVSVAYEEFRSDDGRLQELFSPLLVMARIFGDEDAVKAIESYGRKTEEDICALETSTPEAELVEAISAIVDGRPGDAPEAILNSELAQRLGDSWTPQRIGKVMAALGFRHWRDTKTGRRGYLVDLNLLGRLKVRYRLVPLTSPALSQNLSDLSIVRTGPPSQNADFSPNYGPESRSPPTDKLTSLTNPDEKGTLPSTCQDLGVPGAGETYKSDELRIPPTPEPLEEGADGEGGAMEPFIIKGGSVEAAADAEGLYKAIDFRPKAPPECLPAIRACDPRLLPERYRRFLMGVDEFAGSPRYHCSCGRIFVTVADFSIHVANDELDGRTGT